MTLKTDPEMRKLADEELLRWKIAQRNAQKELQLLLMPKDPNDEKNVLLEIRAGTGGDEATLFAAELFRMYSRLRERTGWRVEIMEAHESEVGGFKEIIAMSRRRPRLQQAQVRKRRAPGAARARHRSQWSDSHFGRHRGRSAGSR